MSSEDADMKRLDNARILMYSHDTFGLGHLRRCRTIAHALVDQFKGLNVLIVSGSPIAGAFDFKARVDFVKVPSVIKLHNGEYTSLDEHIDLEETLTMRKSIIRLTAETFKPDIFIVDKEPLGLHGELEETLLYLKEVDCTLVVGMRDVMDSPRFLKAEWDRREIVPKLDAIFDDIWVYGPPSFWNPLTGLNVPESLAEKITYTGYLERALPADEAAALHPLPENYILVTAGGGGDGFDLMNAVLAAYELDNERGRSGLTDAVLVLGPFIPKSERETIVHRAEALGKVSLIDFDNRIEYIISRADGIVGMGGYNTFCEILSFDKRALIVPRTLPREEQLIRAKRAEELGVVDMLLPEASEDPKKLIDALLALPKRKKPSEIDCDLPLDGLSKIGKIIEKHLEKPSAPELRVVRGECKPVHEWQSIICS
ncbi:MAG: glycosyltransferase family protein [Hyphomicrobiales bacterium]